MSDPSSVYLSATLPVSGTFELLHFGGFEQISSCFEFTLTLSSDNNTIDFDEMMGKSVTVSMDVGGSTRYFNGIVGRFEQISSPPESYNEFPPAVYVAHIYPQAWLMKFSSNCRIFQNQTTLAIIQQVLSDNSITISNNVESHGNDTRIFCVQYNESDFDFISRLMEEVGIFYYFDHSDGSHTMVLGDSSTANQTCSNASSAQIAYARAGGPFLMGISNVQITQKVVPTENTWVSYNFQTPQTQLKADVKGPTDGQGGTMYHYPGYFQDQSSGEQWTQTRMEADESLQKSIRAESTIPFFEAGCSFSLKGHPQDSVNTDYVLYRVEHDARSAKNIPIPHTFDTQKNTSFWGASTKMGVLYVNRFMGFTKTSVFRPPMITPRPAIYGTQTAIVTGQQDAEIYTEEYGRIKVKFHWDINGQENENSSCWIRVATPWAGQGWGVTMTPRIGQEVVIAFMNGDPDYPLVVGSVYNGANKPPYLPDSPAKATIKSNTTKDGQNAHNEITMDDTKGSEQVYLHAQKDLVVDIQNNETRTLTGGSRTTTLQAGEESEEESPNQGNDTLTLQKGNHTVHIVEGNHAFTIDQGNYSITLTEGNLTVTLTEGNMTFSAAAGDITFDCSGTFSVTAGADIAMEAGGAMEVSVALDSTTEVGGAAEITVGGDVTVTVGGATEITVGGDIAVTVGGATEITVGGDVAVTVGGATEITAGADVAVTAGAAIEVTAGGDLALTAGGAGELTAGGDVSVTGGGAAEFTGGGTATLTGATVEITGALVTIT